MVLCVLCVNYKFKLDDECGTSLSKMLVQIIAEKGDDNIRASLAADLIGKGIS
jgi:hypothetical protein